MGSGIDVCSWARHSTWPSLIHGLIFQCRNQTAWTVYAFFKAMALYPDVQSRAQAEIDAVVGTSRLPRLSDRQKLPYIEAMVLECLRWHPVAPLGIHLRYSE